MLKPPGRLLRVAALTVLALALGTVGYMVIEDWSGSDALFMTAITLSTVGFGEVRPLSADGRLFTIALIFMGVGIIVYSFSAFAEYLFSFSMEQEFRRRRTRNMVKKLRNHIVICGYGQVGTSATASLVGSGQQVVIVDDDPARISLAYDAGLLAIEGDASSDEVLLEAGLEQARGAIICTGDDALNLFVVLSARSINPRLFIVARANAAANEKKMRQAGADRVVSPYQIGGRHMANIMIRPQVTDFFDVVTLKGGEELWIEELAIRPGSPLQGKTVGEADIRQKTGVMLVALYRREIGTKSVPDATTRLQAGDELIVLGTREQLATLQGLTAGEPVAKAEG